MSANTNTNLSVRIAAAQYPLSFFTSFHEWKNKTSDWVQSAIANRAEYLVFPEYGSMELTSLLTKEQRADLKAQALALGTYLGDFQRVFSELAQKHKVYIIAPSFPVVLSSEKTVNRCFVFSPNGQNEYQDKLFMTRFEDEEWNVQSGESEIKIFSTPRLKFSVVTCFDIEFAFPSLTAAHAGADVIFVPSCTETLKGANRVHIGARARALENQIYTVVAQTVGDAAWSPAVDINTGFAAVYTTPDTGFTDDGVFMCGKLNESQWLHSEIRISHLSRVRTSGAVLNFRKHADFLQNREPFYKIIHVEL